MDASPFASLAAGPSAEPTEVELRPARINDRFIAYLLDIGPFLVGYMATLYVLWVRLAKEPPSLESAERLGLMWCALLLLYQTAGNLLGGTVGKRLMSLAVVRRDGSRLGVLASVVRAVGFAAGHTPLNWGFVLALFHPESRAFHDLLCGSVVVESRPKHPSEAVTLFLGAVLSCVGVVVGGSAWHLSQPLPSDLLAIEKAHAGLQVLAQIQEKYKKENGHYTAKLGELAAASGDVESFRSSMGEIFQHDLFRLEVSLTGYKISAAARDRKKTRVSIQGP